MPSNCKKPLNRKKKAKLRRTRQIREQNRAVVQDSMDEQDHEVENNGGLSIELQQSLEGLECNQVYRTFLNRLSSDALRVEEAWLVEALKDVSSRRSGLTEDRNRLFHMIMERMRTHPELAPTVTEVASIVTDPCFPMDTNGNMPEDSASEATGGAEVASEPTVNAEQTSHEINEPVEDVAVGGTAGGNEANYIVEGAKEERDDRALDVAKGDNTQCMKPEGEEQEVNQLGAGDHKEGQLEEVEQDAGQPRKAEEEGSQPGGDEQDRDEPMKIVVFEYVPQSKEGDNSDREEPMKIVVFENLVEEIKMGKRNPPSAMKVVRMDLDEGNLMTEEKIEQDEPVNNEATEGKDAKDEDLEEKKINEDDDSESAIEGTKKPTVKNVSRDKSKGVKKMKKGMRNQKMKMPKKAKNKLATDMLEKIKHDQLESINNITLEQKSVKDVFKLDVLGKKEKESIPIAATEKEKSETDLKEDEVGNVQNKIVEKESTAMQGDLIEDAVEVNNDEINNENDKLTGDMAEDVPKENVSDNEACNLSLKLTKVEDDLLNDNEIEININVVIEPINNVEEAERKYAEDIKETKEKGDNLDNNEPIEKTVKEDKWENKDKCSVGKNASKKTTNKKKDARDDLKHNWEEAIRDMPSARAMARDKSKVVQKTKKGRRNRKARLLRELKNKLKVDGVGEVSNEQTMPTNNGPADVEDAIDVPNCAAEGKENENVELPGTKESGEDNTIYLNELEADENVLSKNEEGQGDLYVNVELIAVSEGKPKLNPNETKMAKRKTVVNLTKMEKNILNEDVLARSNETQLKPIQNSEDKPNLDMKEKLEDRAIGIKENNLENSDMKIINVHGTDDESKKFVVRDKRAQSDLKVTNMKETGEGNQPNVYGDSEEQDDLEVIDIEEIYMEEIDELNRMVQNGDFDMQCDLKEIDLGETNRSINNIVHGDNEEQDDLEVIDMEEIDALNNMVDDLKLIDENETNEQNYKVTEERYDDNKQVSLKDVNEAKETGETKFTEDTSGADKPDKLKKEEKIPITWKDRLDANDAGEINEKVEPSYNMAETEISQDIAPLVMEEIKEGKDESGKDNANVAENRMDESIKTFDKDYSEKPSDQKINVEENKQEKLEEEMPKLTKTAKKKGRKRKTKIIKETEDQGKEQQLVVDLEKKEVDMKQQSEVKDAQQEQKGNDGAIKEAEPSDNVAGAAAVEENTSIAVGKVIKKRKRTKKPKVAREQVDQGDGNGQNDSNIASYSNTVAKPANEESDYPKTDMKKEETNPPGIEVKNETDTLLNNTASGGEGIKEKQKQDNHDFEKEKDNQNNNVSNTEMKSKPSAPRGKKTGKPYVNVDSAPGVGEEPNIDLAGRVEMQHGVRNKLEKQNKPKE